MKHWRRTTLLMVAITLVVIGLLQSVQTAEPAPIAAPKVVQALPFEGSCTPKGQIQQPLSFDQSQNLIWLEQQLVTKLSDLGGTCLVSFPLPRDFLLDSEQGTIILDNKVVPNGKDMKLTGVNLSIVYEAHQANGFSLRLKTYQLFLPVVGRGKPVLPTVGGKDNLRSGCFFDGSMHTMVWDWTKRLIYMPWQEQALAAIQTQYVYCGLATDELGILEALGQKMYTGPGFFWDHTYPPNDPFGFMWKSLASTPTPTPLPTPTATPIPIPFGQPAVGACSFNGQTRNLLWDSGTRRLWMPWESELRQAIQSQAIVCGMSTNSPGVLSYIGLTVDTVPGFAWNYTFPRGDPSPGFDWKQQ